jgi:hypothetical protein
MERRAEEDVAALKPAHGEHAKRELRLIRALKRVLAVGPIDETGRDKTPFQMVKEIHRAIDAEGGD